MKLEYITKILNTSGKEISKEGKIPNHAYIYFTCEKCGKEDNRKQKRRIAQQDNLLFCPDCTKKYTNQKRYGYDNAQSSPEVKSKIGKKSKENNNISLMKKNLMEKYGVDNASKIDSVKEKRKNTNIERFGGVSPCSSPFVNNSLKQTNLQRYGVEYYPQTNSFKKSVEETNLKKLGVKTNLLDEEFVKRKKRNDFDNYYKEKLCNLEEIKPLFSKEEYIGKRRHFEYKWKCKACGEEFEDYIFNTHVPRCPKCFPFVKSRPEKEVGDFIKEIYSGEVIENSREIIPPLELDIYLPEENLAIEFDGLYWHSIEHKEKEYHLKKSEVAESKGIQILHIFEDEWRDKQEIVKNIIKYKLGLVKKVYARKTIFKEIDSKEAKEFLDKTHIDGFHGAKHHYGLFHENELVAVISMGVSRYNKNYDWEIVRAGYKYRVIGGLSKLLKNFRKIHSGSIITYANRRYFDGKGYLSVGFNFVEDSQQNYYYTDFVNRYSRVMFQKHKLENKLDFFDSNLTEKENMLLNDYSIIYDCGSKVFEMKE